MHLRAGLLTWPQPWQQYRASRRLLLGHSFGHRMHRLRGGARGHRVRLWTRGHACELLLLLLEAAVGRSLWHVIGHYLRRGTHHRRLLHLLSWHLLHHALRHSLWGGAGIRRQRILGAWWWRSCSDRCGLHSRCPCFDRRIEVDLLRNRLLFHVCEGSCEGERPLTDAELRHRTAILGHGHDFFDHVSYFPLCDADTPCAPCSYSPILEIGRAHV